MEWLEQVKSLIEQAGKGDIAPREAVEVFQLALGLIEDCSIGEEREDERFDVVERVYRVLDGVQALAIPRCKTCHELDLENTMIDGMCLDCREDPDLIQIVFLP